MKFQQLSFLRSCVDVRALLYSRVAHFLSGWVRGAWFPKGKYNLAIQAMFLPSNYSSASFHVKTQMPEKFHLQALVQAASFDD